MSRFAKLLKRLRELDKNLRFDEIKKLLEAYGYKMESSGGSHRTFRKSGEKSATMPEKDPVKRVYLVMAKEAIESELKKNERKEEND